ncbi:MAG: Peptidyl-tRNA hydrolase ArfB [Nitrosomonadaceae bacterium]|nr:Peptidyl-tRNA hydrolase ArfB [Nitrosomonadaceae bacterium]
MLMLVIPESEIEFEFVRSSGPGGQNVNKTSTKAQLRWPVFASSVLSNQDKQTLATRLAHRITEDGYLAIDVSEERSQLRNKQRALELLHSLVNQALEPQKRRLRTRPTRASVAKHLDNKRKRGQIKQSRQPVAED